tara:strand:+ start:830 stop:1318 length:489 start_codon:yes stop_codon:yes gene_type:complete
MEKKLISVIMGSQSDWKTMRFACDILEEFKINYEKKIISAHRTPDRLFNYAKNAHKRQIKVIIAGAGGAAHLPGMVASKTLLPVIGVPILSEALSGVDSLYSIVQMPKGCPVATMAIGIPGAVNSSIFAISILSLNDRKLAKKLKNWYENTTSTVPLVPKDE